MLDRSWAGEVTSAPKLLVHPMCQALRSIDREVHAVGANGFARADVLFANSIRAKVSAHVEHAHPGHALGRLANDRVDTVDPLVKFSAIVAVVFVRADRIRHG